MTDDAVIDADALAELLRAATELQTQVKDGLATVTDDEDDLDVGLEVPTMEQMAAHVALLEDQLQAALASSAPGEDPAVDVEAGDGMSDFADLDEDEELAEGPDGLAAGSAEDAEFDLTLAPSEGKADGFGDCPECGSSDADVYADGTARCEDCGTPLAPREEKGWDLEPEGVDFDEPDEDPVDVKELAGAVLDVYQALGALFADASDGDLAPETAIAADGVLTEFEVLQARRAGLST